MRSPLLFAADLTVNAVAFGMVALGAALFMATLRFWRSAGEDPAALAPLEVMGDRRFARADEDGRAAILNGVRPTGAEHPAEIVAPPVLDHEPAEQVRTLRDTFDHTVDAVDVVEATAVPRVIDPLLSRATENDEPAR
ncbi:MAG: hypothetical protein ACO36A_05320 [Ilumatobacteraceae bacterium]